MFVEYNWTALAYQFRFGQVFTAVRGVRSCATLAEVKDVLASAGLRLGSKTDSRTWLIESL